MLNGIHVSRLDVEDLTPGRVDGGGSLVEYRYGGRPESGWFNRVARDGALMIDSFSGDYGVSHWIAVEQITRVYSAAKMAEIRERQWRADGAWPQPCLARLRPAVRPGRMSAPFRC